MKRAVSGRGGQPGNEIQMPLAIVVLFGLLSSTSLNMIVVPALLLRWAHPAPPQGPDPQVEGA